METRNPVEGYFGSKFPAISNHCGVMTAWSRKTLEIFAFLEKNDPIYDKICKILFRKFSSRHRSTCCVQISWNLADGKSVRSCVTYLTKKFRLLPSCRYCADHAQNMPDTRQCTQSASDFHPNWFTLSGLEPSMWTPPNRTVKCIQSLALSRILKLNKQLQNSTILCEWNKL